MKFFKKTVAAVLAAIVMSTSVLALPVLADGREELAAYRDIIAQYQNALEDDDFEAHTEQYRNLVPDFTMSKDHILGYVLYDVDNNGILELLIMNDKKEPLDIFTYKDGAAVRAIPFAAEGGASWTVLKNGTLLLILQVGETNGSIELWDLLVDEDPVFYYIGGGLYETNEEHRAAYGNVDDILDENTYNAFMAMKEDAVDFGDTDNITICPFLGE